MERKINYPEKPEGSSARAHSRALLGGVAAKKLDFLTDRGAKVVCVKVYFEMPNGDEGVVDSWGRVDWNGIRSGILAREVAEIEPPNDQALRSAPETVAERKGK